MTPGYEKALSGAKWAKRKAMYAIDPVQKASRRYMVTSAEILSRTLVRFAVSFAAENQNPVDPRISFAAKRAAN